MYRRWEQHQQQRISLLPLFTFAVIALIYLAFIPSSPRPIIQLNLSFFQHFTLLLKLVQRERERWHTSFGRWCCYCDCSSWALSSTVHKCVACALCTALFNQNAPVIGIPFGEAVTVREWLLSWWCCPDCSANSSDHRLWGANHCCRLALIWLNWGFLVPVFFPCYVCVCVCLSIQFVRSLVPNCSDSTAAAG